MVLYKTFHKQRILYIILNKGYDRHFIQINIKNIQVYMREAQLNSIKLDKFLPHILGSSLKLSLY